MATRLAEYLDEIRHQGPRVLIHSDLESVEWKDSLPVCERLAKRLGWELIVVRRKAGDMMDRWESRWKNNLARYACLECVKIIILPWSTPGMRFCTGELKPMPYVDTSLSATPDKKSFPPWASATRKAVREQSRRSHRRNPNSRRGDARESTGTLSRRGPPPQCMSISRVRQR
jgi:hypothetical protein